MNHKINWIEYKKVQRKCNKWIIVKKSDTRIKHPVNYIWEKLSILKNSEQQAILSMDRTQYGLIDPCARQPYRCALKEKGFAPGCKS